MAKKKATRKKAVKPITNDPSAPKRGRTADEILASAPQREAAPQAVDPTPAGEYCGHCKWYVDNTKPGSRLFRGHCNNEPTPVPKLPRDFCARWTARGRSLRDLDEPAPVA